MKYISLRRPIVNLLAIGDPIIDTHVQIEDNCLECHLASDSKHLCLNYGQKIPITDSFQSLGGNAPNVAVGAARLGLTSGVLSTVGKDAYGKLAVQHLKKAGVDTSLISYDADHQTRYSLVLSYHSERTILSYSEEKKYHWPKNIPFANWIYYTGLSKGFETVQEKLFDYLDTHPTTRLAINPGSYILKYAKGKLILALAKADLLIVNLEEAEALLNTTLSAEKNISHLIHDLFKLGPREVVITDGVNGAWAGTREEILHLPAFPVPVVSKTGAGDAFSSAYIAARFYDHSINEALKWGTANSAGVVQAHGPHEGLFDREKIKDFLNHHPDNRPRLV